VLDDYLAMDLADAEGFALRERLRAEVPRALLLAFARWTCVRARLAEDVAEGSVSDGVSQYVILGAGLDSFVYRRRDLLDRLRVFEVDHPATQSWKRRRLAAIGVEIPVDLAYAPIDFETQTLRESLEAAGFDFSLRAVFSWIGSIQYLTLDAISSTLEVIMGFLSRFLPGDLDLLLRRHGFGDTVDFGPENARDRYFGGRAEVDVGSAERIMTATVMQSG